MPLKEEIEDARRLVATDEFSMSLGEVTNLFRDGEIVINPNFQRLFRWSDNQKSSLIESILMGIPIPPIFVFEKDDGVWELIDGLQRVSTILQFQGLLSDLTGEAYPPLVLSRTEYLPALEQKVWSKDLGEHFTEDQDIGQSNRIAVKRSKIGVQILKRDSDERSKYDLFQRLNGKGSTLNSQELRSCMMVMINEDKFDHVKRLSRDENFRTLLRLKGDRLERQEDVDRASRFLVHMTADITRQFDVEEFIDHQIQNLFVETDIRPLVDLGIETAQFLADQFGDSALRRYENGDFSGKVGLVGFEGVFVGVASNLTAIRQTRNPEALLREKLSNFWRSDEVARFLAPGQRGTTRIEASVPFGKDFFNP